MFGSRISLKTGSEGPKYDPYSYDEWTVHRVNSTGVQSVTLHTGLVEWVKIDGVRDRSGESPYEVFERLTRIPPEQLETIYYRVHYRCPDHPRAPITQTDGFPGETLNVCTVCNKIISTDFSERSII